MTLVELEAVMRTARSAVLRCACTGVELCPHERELQQAERAFVDAGGETLDSRIQHEVAVREGHYRVIDGILQIRLNDKWSPYKGLCQGCRHPGDEHTCPKGA